MNTEELIFLEIGLIARHIYSNIYLFATTIDFQDVLQFKDNKQKVNNVYRVSIACHNKND